MRIDRIPGIYATRSFSGALRHRLFGRAALASCVLLAVCAVVSPCFALDGSRLEKIEVVGLKRLTQEQVVTSSGLQLGQNIDREILRAAADKMMKSKLFSSVGYRVATDDDGKSTVTFEVVETDKPAPTATPTPKSTRPRTTRRHSSQ